MKRAKRKWLYPSIAAVILLAAAAIGYLVGSAPVEPEALQNAEPSFDQTGTEESLTEAVENIEVDDTQWEGTVSYNGQVYKKNRNLKTILFMGIDNKVSQTDMIGSGGRSDALILLIVDKKEKTAQMLEISRDTMTDVDVYDNDGKYVYTAEMQINMQYEFGDSPRRSCYLTKKKVSELLFGLDIDYYCSLTMDGISVIVDGMDGITLTLPENCSEIDPSYVAGATVHMDGKAVEHFVRSRDMQNSGGNDARMERQNWFLLELVRQLKSSKRIPASALIDLAEPYMETDLDADTLALINECTLKDESCKVPGSTTLGEVHDEYYVDDDALRELIIQLFYLPVN